MHISITGLKPKGFFGLMRFWALAIPSFRQAQTAKGNLHVSAKKMKGYRCTLSAWDSRDSMLAFMKNGAHKSAMKAFHSIATGRIYGYDAETLPTWEEAFTLLMEKGRNYE
jgi:hypothetical protein